MKLLAALMSHVVGLSLAGVDIQLPDCTRREQLCTYLKP